TVVSGLAPYPDLLVSNLTLEPAAPAASGQPVTLRWRVSNPGLAAVTGSWTDNVVVRNLTTGQKLIDAGLRYNAAVDGPLSAGGFVDRAYTFLWPAGAGA